MKKVKERGLTVLAIDLGGTKVRTAIISDKGEIIAEEYCPTLADEGPEPVMGRILSGIDRVLRSGNVNSSQLHSISIAAAGAIDSRKGLITVSPNLPGWRDVPIRDIVKSKYEVTTFLVNDASAAALGEHRFGAGKGVNNLIYLTVSTGIGGGIIIDGKLYTGPSGSAGEIGHMIIDVHGPECNCGRNGCLEAMASGTAVAREAIRRIREGEKSSLVGIVDGEIDNITAEKVSIAARDGDSLASEVISEAAAYLGIGMVNVVNIFNPEMIVVGGGMSKMGDLLLAPARQVVKEMAFELPAKIVRIVPARLGDDNGLLGAAAFAFQQKI